MGHKKPNRVERKTLVSRMCEGCGFDYSQHPKSPHFMLFPFYPLSLLFEAPKSINREAYLMYS